MKKWFRENLWRHAYATLMCLFALLPIYLIVLSAFSNSGSLKVSSFLPNSISFSKHENIVSIYIIFHIDKKSKVI